MPKISILPANDPEIIQELAYQIWPAYYDAIIGPDQTEYMLRLLYNPDDLKQQQESGEMLFQVNLVKKPVGFLGLKPQNKDQIKLTKLYLSEEMRGLGLGRTLLDFALNYSRENHFKWLILNVNRFNPTLNFYLRQGFTIQQQVDIPFGPFWLNDYIMEKKIEFPF